MTDQEKSIVSLLGAGLALFMAIAACTVVSQIYQTRQPMPGTIPGIPSLEPVTRPTQGSLAVEYILDASGSMNETLLDGTRKADAARQLLSASLNTYRPETGLGLRVYGHRLPETPREPSCQDIELIAPLEPGYQGQMATWLQNGYQPQGMTPIATALQQAVADFSVEPGRVNSIVLISDGQETCGGDPCQVVRDLETAGIRFSLHVIGLNVDDSTRAQLTCIAQAGGGEYQDANTSQELQTALEVVQQQVVQPQPTLAVEPPTEPPPTPAPPSTPVPSSATPTAPVPPSTNNSFFEGQIAYTGIDNNIYVLRGNSPTPIQITFDGNTDNLYYAPAWSPDGKQLAYLLTHSNNNDGLTPKTLYISNPDNNQHAVYLENVGFGFDWSPEGNIIFDRAADYSKVMYPQDIPDQASGIWKLDIASGGTVEIIPRLADQNPLANPDYSPNGNWILFSQLMWESALLNIYAVSNGAVFPINDYFPCKGNWSPDGNNLVFISLPIGRYEIILKTYSPYEGKIRDIYQNNIMEGGNMGRAFWSADGKHIIFGTPDGVMQVNPDGSSPLLLTDLGYPLDTSFQSNQVLIANKDNLSELMIYDMTTLAFTHVTASYQNCDIFGNTYVSIGCGQNVDWGPLP